MTNPHPLVARLLKDGKGTRMRCHAKEPEEWTCYTCSLEDYETLTFDDLAAVVEYFGTRLVDIEYTANERDWSDVTPGSDSYCYLCVHLERVR